MAKFVLPTPGAPKSRTFSRCDEAAGRQLPHQTLIDRGLEPEFEIIERLFPDGKWAIFSAIVTGPLLGVALLAHHGVEKSRYVGSVRAAITAAYAARSRPSVVSVGGSDGSSPVGTGGRR